jgi:ribonuclease BN (tRNA processing enzyme)
MHLLLDCGATSLVALKQLGIDVGSVDAVVVSHLHGDHFAGIPFLILDQQFARRQRPLVLAGPPGLRDRVLAAMEVLFPGSASVERRFEVRFVELAAREPAQIGEVSTTGYPVIHASGAPAYGLRLAWEGKVIAYSGDTACTESLVELADNAELFICEAYTFDRQVPYHLSYARLAEHWNEFTARRIVLTHPSPDMLQNHHDIEAELVQDGTSIVI